MAIRLIFECAVPACRRRYNAAELLRAQRFPFDQAAECHCGSTRFFVFVEPVPT